MIDSGEINYFRFISRKLPSKTELQQHGVARRDEWMVGKKEVKREATGRLVYWLHNEV